MNKEVSFILLFPLLVFLGVFVAGININYLASLLLMFGVPSFYLSFRNRKKIKKVALFSLLVSIPTATIFEFITRGDHAWNVPQSVFSYRFFGFIPFEDYLWMFLTMYLILIFYEHFCNKQFQPRTSPKIKKLYVILYVAVVLVLTLHFIRGSFVEIPYAYLWLCIPFFFIPITFFLSRYPSYISTFFPVQMFFFYIHLLFEFIGVYLHHWEFPGTHYLGWVSFLSLKFPIEEFFFVILFGGLAPLVYYEYFTNKHLEKR